mmetsp:Transcript_25490/g.59710  ORF Transcript_25490/g.59710 Transcript_25490/m.59710 type:complete len:265 (+) Transcript_25490:2001-2795(+)
MRFRIVAYEATDYLETGVRGRFTPAVAACRALELHVSEPRSGCVGIFRRVPLVGSSVVASSIVVAWWQSVAPPVVVVVVAASSSDSAEFSSPSSSRSDFDSVAREARNSTKVALRAEMPSARDSASDARADSDSASRSFHSPQCLSCRSTSELRAVSRSRILERRSRKSRCSKEVSFQTRFWSCPIHRSKIITKIFHPISNLLLLWLWCLFAVVSLGWIIGGGDTGCCTEGFSFGAESSSNDELTAAAAPTFSSASLLRMAWRP